MMFSTEPLQTSSPAPFSNYRQRQSNHLQNFIDSTIDITNLPLRHLASKSTLASSNSHQRSEIHRPHFKATHFHPSSITFDDQRAEPSHGFSITKSTKPWDPTLSAISVPSLSQSGRNSFRSNVNRRSKTDSSLGGEIIEKPVAHIPNTHATEGNDESIYPNPLGLGFLIVGLCLSVFLISLDRTIITTAIPFITSEFKSYNDIGWYGSAYLLTASAFQPLYGRVFQLFNIKWSYLSSLAMFELGSLVCGAAPNSTILIIGRALAGLGSAGILTGSFVVISHAVPLKKRPIWTAVVGLMFGVGATIGPLLGGAFTDFVSWRWCFYFNLPVGVATVISMVIFFHPPKSHAMMDRSFLQRLLHLDILGNLILLAACLMLFLALSYAEKKSWSSSLVIGLLIGSGVTFVLFCIWQLWKGESALMPPRIIGQRSVASSCAAAFFIYSAILIHSYYLPLWFQAVHGDSALNSGINMIPYVVANAVFSIIAGIFVSKNGYFAAPAIVGCAIGTIGAGLISIIGPNTPSSMWIGFEILASVGIGMAIQQGFTAIQVVLPLEEVAIGTAAVVAFQSLGGAIFVSVGNTILQNSLRSAANRNEVPGVNIDAVIKAGAGSFRELVPRELLPALLVVYNGALRKVFTAAIVMIAFGFVACLFLEWRSIKEEKHKVDEELYG